MASRFGLKLPVLNQLLLSMNCSLLTQLSNLCVYLPAHMYSGKCYNYPDESQIEFSFYLASTGKQWLEHDLIT